MTSRWLETMAVWLSRRGTPDVSVTCPGRRPADPPFVAVEGGRTGGATGHGPAFHWRCEELLRPSQPKCPKKLVPLRQHAQQHTISEQLEEFEKVGNLVLVRRPQGFNCMVKCTKPAEQALWALERQSRRARVIKSWKFLVAKKSPENSTNIYCQWPWNKQTFLNTGSDIFGRCRLKAQKVSMRLKWVMKLVSSLSSRKRCPAFKLRVFSSRKTEKAFEIILKSFCICFPSVRCLHRVLPQQGSLWRLHEGCLHQDSSCKRSFDSQTGFRNPFNMINKMINRLTTNLNWFRFQQYCYLLLWILFIMSLYYK